MSITLNVYAHAPFAEAELKKWLANPKFAAGLQWIIEFEQDPSLSGGQTVRGHRPTKPDEVGVVSFTTVKRGDPPWEDVAGAEVIRETPAEYRRKIADANVLYAIETSANRSRASLDLQQMLWATIGALTEGLVEDPQEGEYHDTKSEIATIDSEKRLHMLVNGTFALLVATEIAVFAAQLAMGQARWLSTVVHIIVVGALWWTARDRDSFGRWFTVVFAATIVYFDSRIAIAVADDNSGRALAHAIRAAIYTLAAGIMLLPKTGTYFKRGDHE